MHRRLSELLNAIAALGFGLVVALALAAALGENPWTVLKVMISGAFGSATSLGYSLYFATPLLFTGLSVAWALRAGLFNIGAEGQMTLGGVTMAGVGILAVHWPWYVGLPFALLAAFCAGGFWGAIAGWLKVRRGCHEVLTTILLNFVAAGLASFLILSVFKDPTSQSPETSPVGAGFQIPPLPAWLSGNSPLNWSFVLGLVAIGGYGFVMKSTLLGFRQRLTGAAAEVGRRAGIDVDRQTILAMFLSGGFAALAAASPVLGFALKARDGFTSGAGFVGIAVALLAGPSSVGLIASAVLFGALMKGSLDLDLDTQFVSRDLATVIQALMIVAIACRAGLSAFAPRMFRRRNA